MFACTVFFVTAHCFVNAKDVGRRVMNLVCRLKTVASKVPNADDRNPQKARVDKALADLVERNFIYASHLLQHSIFIAVVMLMQTEGTTTILVGASLVYLVHACVAHGALTMTDSRIRLYMSVLFCIGTAEWFETKDSEPSKMPPSCDHS